jgi:hypothetical protein
MVGLYVNWKLCGKTSGPGINEEVLVVIVLIVA